MTAEAEGLDRDRDDVWLRDGLPAADGQRRVLVGELGEVVGHERLARHAAERLEHARVRDAPAGELELDHATANVRLAHGPPPLLPVHPRCLATFILDVMPTRPDVAARFAHAMRAGVASARRSRRASLLLIGQP
jgi:hypothetical protein